MREAVGNYSLDLYLQQQEKVILNYVHNHQTKEAQEKVFFFINKILIYYE